MTEKPSFDINLPFVFRTMVHRTVLLFAIVLIVVVGLLSQQMGCSLLGSDSETPTETFDFSERPDDWSAMFSNYHVGREDDFELESGYRPLPEPLDTTRYGFYLSGKNLSDDLNMFLKHRLDDLDPETSYEIKFEVSFATNAPSGCAGVGGAPGEGVTVHTSASEIEPDRVVDDSRQDGFYRLNLAENYSGDEQSWYRATEIGDVANSRECEEGRQYEIKTVSSGEQSVTTDEEGGAWLLVGTRSGFEATTSLYYTEVKIYLSED